MSEINNCVIRENDTTLTDITVEMNNVYSQTHTMDIVAAEDAIYLGSDLPFTHRWILVSTVNDQASVASVKLWDGNGFDHVAVNVKDRTSVGGVTLAQSGILSWGLDKDDSWVAESTTEDIPDLSTLRLYDKYWAKVEFSGDLNASTAIQFVGHKFSDDEHLGAEYQELTLSATLSAFESGKTDWDEQHVVAAEEVIRKLRKARKIWSPGQILDWEVFEEAATHYAAYIIYRNFGESRAEKRDQAFKDYQIAFNGIDWGLDRNQDGRLSNSEKVKVARFIRR